MAKRDVSLTKSDMSGFIHRTDCSGSGENYCAGCNLRIAFGDHQPFEFRRPTLWERIETWWHNVCGT